MGRGKSWIHFAKIFVQSFHPARTARTNLLDLVNVGLLVAGLLFSSNQYYPFNPRSPYSLYIPDELQYQNVVLYLTQLEF